MTLLQERLTHLLDSKKTVYAASAISLALGLGFVFVLPPHPWGWRGIDQYHELARALARGEPFGTTDVPWGYAYYVAGFYWLFGDVLWAPLVGQVLLNALVPLFLYHLVRRLADHRTAVLSALLVGVLSFNTVYASTQSSDSVCTVGFLAMLLCFLKGAESGRIRWFAASGLLAGVVAQFRPNLILFPFVIAGVYLLLPTAVARTRSVASAGVPAPALLKRLAHAAIHLALVVAALAPWTIRNYRLTGEFLPTSTHGSVQLWYGTLQTGPYLESRAHNPRSAFEAPAFDYTSLANRPLIISATPRECPGMDDASVQIVYWTSRDAARRALAMRREPDGTFSVQVPGQPAPTTVYYFFDTTGPSEGGSVVAQRTPPAGAADPYIFLIAGDHLTNLDEKGDLLDVFDLIRMLRFLAWSEPLPFHDRLDFDDDGRITRTDVDRVVRSLAVGAEGTDPSLVGDIETTPAFVRMTLTDGSTFEVPREWGERVTDLSVDGELASVLVYQRRSFASLAQPPARGPGDGGIDMCRVLDRVAVNDVFYRKEPHLMRRYTALAFDNIRRDPVAFLAASVYRVGRLFIIRGTDDRHTTQQFGSSGALYTIGFVLSLAYLAAFLAGVWIAWRRRSRLLLLLIPIVYLPLTISYVLTNMRYTITVQPFLFAFIAFAILTWLDGRPRRQWSAPSGE